MSELQTGLRHRIPRWFVSGRAGILVVAATLSPMAMAQVADLAPVAVDDSPVADRLLAEVDAQAADNPRRAAELAAELLDAYADRVVADPDRPDVFRSVRSAIIEVLESAPDVLDAWNERVGDEAVAMLEVAGPLETWRRRPMTPAGLEAAFRLAQRSIESGSAESGLRLLDALVGWPGLDAEMMRERRAMLVALAWVRIAEDSGRPADQRRRDEAIGQVRAAGAVAALTEWAASRSATDAATPPDDDPSRREWTVLWEAPLEASLHRRRTTDLASGRPLGSNAEVVRRIGMFLTSVPAIFGDLVIVNEGHIIEAIDRYTGRLRWFRDFGSAQSFTSMGRPGDLGEIVLDGEDAYTILGNAFNDRPTGERAIIRFDPSTGRVRWTMRPDRSGGDPLLEDAEAVGAPMILGDLVVVPLRKVTSRLETIDLVLALDRSDGSVRWLRSIASSGSVRTSDRRPVSRLNTVDGDVLVASSAGAIARLDGLSGSVVWLRRQDVPLNGLGRVFEAWQIAAPVVTDLGVVTLDAARRHWQLIDPETGDLVEEHPIGPGTTAGNPARIDVVPGALDGSDLLLFIGTDIVAVDPATPTVPMWSLSEKARDAGLSIESVDAPGVRGRVVVEGGTILVPTVDAVLSIDPGTGTVHRLFEIDGPVNPMLAADAILVAGSESLATMMPVLDAVATLERRIRESPDAVSQAMALLELAARIGRSDLQLLAARAAVDGLSGPDGELWRDEVLDLLLDAVPSAGEADGAVLLDLAADTAVDVGGRVRHRLARAAWLQSRGRGLEAIDEWLGIIGDPTLASVMIRVADDFDVAAGTVARSRLRETRSLDAEVARRLDAQATERMNAAIAARETASVFANLARQAVDSDAAVLAASRAVEILRDEGDPLSVAAVAMVVARGFEPEDPRRVRLLRDAATACADAGRSDLTDVLSRLAGVSDTTVTLPQVGGVPDHIESIRGRLVPVAPEARGHPPADLILFHEPDTSELVARDADGLGERWRRPWSAEVRIVQWSPDLLVWEGADQRLPVLHSLDEKSGEIRWSTPAVSQLLPAPDRLAVNTDGFLPDGGVFQPWEILVVPCDRGVMLVRRDGAISLVDGTDGRTVLWSRRSIMDRVYGFSRGGGLVHLHGSGIDADGEVIGRLVSIDPVQGTIVLDESFEAGEVDWALSEALGRVVVGAGSEIHVVDPIGRRIGAVDHWKRRLPTSSDVELGWVTDRDVVLIDENLSTNVWHLEDGRLDADRWSLPEDPNRGSARPLESIELGRKRVLHLDGRVVMHDSQGRLLGLDAMSIPGRRDWKALPVEGGLLLITRLSVGVPGGSVVRVQRLETDAGLRLGGRPFEISAGRPYTEARVVDGWLLLSTGVETHAVPMSASPESNPEMPTRP